MLDPTVEVRSLDHRARLFDGGQHIENRPRRLGLARRLHENGFRFGVGIESGLEGRLGVKKVVKGLGRRRGCRGGGGLVYLGGFGRLGRFLHGLGARGGRFGGFARGLGGGFGLLGMLDLVPLVGLDELLDAVFGIGKV